MADVNVEYMSPRNLIHLNKCKDYTRYGYIDDGPDFINHRLSDWRNKKKQKNEKTKNILTLRQF